MTASSHHILTKVPLLSVLRLHGGSSQPAVPQCRQIPTWRWPRADSWCSDQPKISLCDEVRKSSNIHNQSTEYFPEISPDTTSPMKFWRRKSLTSIQTLSIKLEEYLWFAEMRPDLKIKILAIAIVLLVLLPCSECCTEDVQFSQCTDYGTDSSTLISSSCSHSQHSWPQNLSVTWDLHNTDLTWPFQWRVKDDFSNRILSR